MTARSLTAIEDARKTADFLESIGEYQRAEHVRRLCRSNGTMRGTLKRLHRDNQLLRGRLGLECFKQ